MTPNDFPSLRVTHDWTLNELARAGADRKSPFRWPVLATSDGTQAHARVIVLRSFGRRDRKALVFTDSRTPKITQLRQNSSATLVFFDSKRSIQIRASGTARLITEGPDHQAAWQKLSESARYDYTTELAPGTETVAAGLNSQNLPELPAHFAMIEIKVHLIDWLLISRQGHLRARFEWKDDALTEAWVTP